MGKIYGTEQTSDTGNPWKEYLKEYRRQHPEKTIQYRINSAKNLLEKKGYTVIAPDTPERNSASSHRRETFLREDGQ